MQNNYGKKINDERRKAIEKLRGLGGHSEPLISYSSEIKAFLSAISEDLEDTEQMMILLEAHPMLPFGKGYSFGADLLDLRRALVYECILRILGHTRSLISNVNIRNHIGTATSVRCLLEIVFFLNTCRNNS
ncbi:hypothetical protein HY229_08630 [Candidatus Acetothermia bacterium]|nr:hypothetical protein [Candidatus Acetothermia bacterium]MBI3644146.1 hypothetical protein [Candidatus Acetothermia bacterium]